MMTEFRPGQEFLMFCRHSGPWPLLILLMISFVSTTTALTSVMHGKNVTTIATFFASDESMRNDDGVIIQESVTIVPETGSVLMTELPITTVSDSPTSQPLLASSQDSVYGNELVTEGRASNNGTNVQVTIGHGRTIQPTITSYESGENDTIEWNMEYVTMVSNTNVTSFLLELNSMQYNDSSRLGFSFTTASLISLVTLPPIFLFGLAGNTLAFLTIRRSFMRKVSTSVYIQVLALSDNLVLLTAIPWRFVYVLTHYRINIDVFTHCHVLSVLMSFSMYYSGWLIVCITCDRLAHCFLLERARDVCTVKRAWCICGALAFIFLIASGINIFMYKTHTSGDVTHCGPRAEMTYFANYVWPILFTILYSYLPSVLILCFGVPIMYKMWVSSHLLPGPNQHHTLQSLRKATAIVALVCFLFVTLTVPIGTYFMISRIRGIIMFDDVTFISLNSLHFLNYSLNFFIYCCSVRRYRTEVRKILMPCMNRMVAPQ